VCDLENLKNEEAMTRVGSQRHNKKKHPYYPKLKNLIKAYFPSYLPVRTVSKCEYIYCLPIKFSMELTIKVKKDRKSEQHSDKPTYLFESIK
jgi:hypothetical protein